MSQSKQKCFTQRAIVGANEVQYKIFRLKYIAKKCDFDIWKYHTPLPEKVLLKNAIENEACQKNVFFQSPHVLFGLNDETKTVNLGVIGKELLSSTKKSLCKIIK